MRTRTPLLLFAAALLILRGLSYAEDPPPNPNVASAAPSNNDLLKALNWKDSDYSRQFCGYIKDVAVRDPKNSPDAMKPWQEACGPTDTQKLLQNLVNIKASDPAGFAKFDQANVIFSRRDPIIVGIPDAIAALNLDKATDDNDISRDKKLLDLFKYPFEKGSGFKKDQPLDPPVTEQTLAIWMDPTQLQQVFPIWIMAQDAKIREERARKHADMLDPDKRNARCDPKNGIDPTGQDCVDFNRETALLEEHKGRLAQMKQIKDPNQFAAFIGEGWQRTADGVSQNPAVLALMGNKADPTGQSAADYKGKINKRIDGRPVPYTPAAGHKNDASLSNGLSAGGSGIPGLLFGLGVAATAAAGRKLWRSDDEKLADAADKEIAAQDKQLEAEAEKQSAANEARKKAEAAANTPEAIHAQQALDFMGKIKSDDNGLITISAHQGQDYEALRTYLRQKANNSGDMDHDIAKQCLDRLESSKQIPDDWKKALGQ